MRLQHLTSLKFQLFRLLRYLHAEMAARYNVHDALSMILDDDFGLSDGDFEGEEVCGYRPECHLNLSVREDRNGNAIEEDGEAMEVGSHFCP